MEICESFDIIGITASAQSPLLPVFPLPAGLSIEIARHIPLIHDPSAFTQTCRQAYQAAATVLYHKAMNSDLPAPVPDPARGKHSYARYWALFRWREDVPAENMCGRCRELATVMGDPALARMPDHCTGPEDTFPHGTLDVDQLTPRTSAAATLKYRPPPE